jgi:hypothetical protein
MSTPSVAAPSISPGLSYPEVQIGICGLVMIGRLAARIPDILALLIAVHAEVAMRAAGMAGASWHERLV